MVLVLEYLVRYSKTCVQQVGFYLPSMMLHNWFVSVMLIIVLHSCGLQISKSFSYIVSCSLWPKGSRFLGVRTSCLMFSPVPGFLFTKGCLNPNLMRPAPGMFLYRLWGCFLI